MNKIFTFQFILTAPYSHQNAPASLFAGEGETIQSRIPAW